MRLAVLSDVHGNAVAFQAVIDDMKRMAPDAVVFLGDIVMRGPQPSECVELLRSLEPLATVRGNYDHMFTRYPKSPDWKPETFKENMQYRAFQYDRARLTAEQQHWIAHWPMGQALTLNGIQTELYHASASSFVQITYPWATLEQLDSLHQYEETKLVLTAHTHHAFVRQAMGRTVVNGGSVGIPFDRDNRASYAVIDLTGNDIAVQLRRVSYDIDRAVAIAKELSMPDVDLFEYGLRHALYPYYEGAVPGPSTSSSPDVAQPAMPAAP